MTRHLAKDAPATGEGEDGLVVIAEPDPEAPGSNQPDGPPATDPTQFSRAELGTEFVKTWSSEGGPATDEDAAPTEFPKVDVQTEFVKTWSKDEPPATGDGEDGLVVIAEPDPNELVANKAMPDTSFPKVEIEPSEEDAARHVFPKVEIHSTATYGDAETPGLSPEPGDIGEKKLPGDDVESSQGDIFRLQKANDELKGEDDPFEMDYKNVGAVDPSPMHEEHLPAVQTDADDLGPSTLVNFDVEPEMKELPDNGFDFDTASLPLEPDDDELPDVDP
jgi:hypothetical protein